MPNFRDSGVYGTYFKSVVIVNINTDTMMAEGQDPSGSKYTINLSIPVGGMFVVVPQRGEHWIIARDGDFWSLDHRGEFQNAAIVGRSSATVSLEYPEGDLIVRDKDGDFKTRIETVEQALVPSPWEYMTPASVNWSANSGRPGPRYRINNHCLELGGGLYHATNSAVSHPYNIATIPTARMRALGMEVGFNRLFPGVIYNGANGAPMDNFMELRDTGEIFAYCTGWSSISTTWGVYFDGISIPL